MIDPTNARIESIQFHYEWLSITREQAERISEYEDTFRYFSENYADTPSMWEESKTEAYHLKKILDQNQYALYQKRKAKQLSEEEQQMRDMDQRSANSLKYHQAILQHKKEMYLPKLLAFKKEQGIEHEPKIKRRINFLKDEYKEHLLITRQKLFYGHFRHLGDLQPIGLENKLTSHELTKIIPDYRNFSRESDPTVRETAKYLLNRLSYYQSPAVEFIKKEHAKLKEERDKLFEKYVRKQAGDIMIIGNDQPEEEKNNDLFMSYLLMDDQKYR